LTVRGQTGAGPVGRAHHRRVGEVLAHSAGRAEVPGRGRCVHSVLRRADRPPDAITVTWPQAVVQLCVVHLIRASLRYASKRYWVPLAKDLRTIYTAAAARNVSVLHVASGVLRRLRLAVRPRYGGDGCRWWDRDRRGTGAAVPSGSGRHGLGQPGRGVCPCRRRAGL
jgi:mutator family transposase